MRDYLVAQLAMVIDSATHREFVPLLRQTIRARLVSLSFHTDGPGGLELNCLVRWQFFLSPGGVG